MTAHAAGTANVAVVGCGYWGKNLVRNFSSLGALHTLCDQDPEQLRRMTETYPQVKRSRGQYEEVLADPEVRAVVLATPAQMHYSMAKSALSAGKDVLVEKPLALRVEEGMELRDLAWARGLILMVGHLLEYHPGIMKLKELVDSGELGKIQYLYSNRLNLGKVRREENILWSFAPHDISVMLHLLGEMPASVTASGGTYLHPHITDVTVTNLMFESGTRAHIFVSWLHPYKVQNLVVVGDRKMASFDDVASTDKLVLYDQRIEWIDRQPVPRKGEGEPVAFEPAEPLARECEHFLESVEKRTPVRTDGENGVRVLQVLEACQASLESGGEIVPLVGMPEQEYFVHETSCVDDPCEIGKGTKIWHYAHVMRNSKIGEYCTISQNVLIASDVIIGNNVKIQNNVSVYTGVVLEDDVFCGPSMVFTNVMNPRSHISRRSEYRQTRVRRGATIGANATVVCGHTIGRYAFVGAGAVVTEDVPDYGLVYGNPARLKGWMCQCGVKLEFPEERESTARCGACGREYRKSEEKVEEVEA